MKSLSVVFLIFLVVIPIYAQTGSINNTLGSGGTFTVKNSSNNAVVVVDEATGQLSAARVKVDGVPSFMAYLIGESGIPSGDTLDSWTEASGYGSHDNSNSFNESTGQFTAPRNGFYFLSAGVELASGASSAALYVYVGSQLSTLAARVSILSTGGAHLSSSGVVKLNSGDVVMLRMTFTGGVSSTGSTGIGWFSGYLVSDF